jgi:D-3-phosphoglycerate dehydrogenase
MPHVLIPDQVDRAALDVFAAAPGFTVAAPGQMDRAAVLHAAADADALLVRSATQVDAELLAAAPRLRMVARAGAGVDNIDLDETSRRGIVVMNTPGGNTTATAEHTLGLMLALVRHVPAAHQSLLEGRWDRGAFMGLELSGKTLGVIGFGRVGQAVAKRALAFEMTILACDPKDIHRPAAEMGVQVTSLAELYARSDIITLHASLTDETRGMIDAAALAAMKSGVQLINTARGALVVAADLADALRRGHVAGAALDVYDPEPPTPDNPLIGLPDVVHTPHLAASTVDAQAAVAVQAARQIVDAFLVGDYCSVVNPQVLKNTAARRQPPAAPAK